MLRLRITGLLIALAVVGLGNLAFSQSKKLEVSGTVYDSLTRLPLPFVTVVNQSANTGTFTDDYGKFRIACAEGDSLFFTMVGYSAKQRVAERDGLAMIVFLQEKAYTLKPVTVYGSYKPQGSEQWKRSIVLPGVFRNPAGPGSGYMVETFGPGISLGGVLSKFTKKEREKRKVKIDREENRRTGAYREVITAQETKDYFQKTFSLTEEEYSKFIESFNVAHPEAVYLPSKEEVMSMLVNFMALKK